MQPPCEGAPLSPPECLFTTVAAREEQLVAHENSNVSIVISCVGFQQCGVCVVHSGSCSVIKHIKLCTQPILDFISGSNFPSIHLFCKGHGMRKLNLHRFETLHAWMNRFMTSLIHNFYAGSVANRIKIQFLHTRY